MSFEQQLEDFLVRCFKRAIVEGLQSLPIAQVPADPGTTAAPARRSRKAAEPKEEAPQASVATEAPPAVAEALPPVTIQTPVVAQAAAAVQDSPAATEALPQIERRHVSAALITVAQAPEHGPSVAYGILTGLGAKEVNALKPAQYVEVVATAAKILGITVADALKLEPKKA